MILVTYFTPVDVLAGVINIAVLETAAEAMELLLGLPDSAGFCCRPINESQDVMARSTEFIIAHVARGIWGHQEDYIYVGRRFDESIHHRLDNGTLPGQFSVHIRSSFPEIAWVLP